jgi:hypothetical protein
VTIVGGLSGRGIESVEAADGSKPQHTSMVLADIEDGNRFALRARGVDAVVSKCLGDRVEFIQELIASDPKYGPSGP